jgi:hypothetical protein
MILWVQSARFRVTLSIKFLNFISTAPVLRRRRTASVALLIALSLTKVRLSNSITMSFNSLQSTDRDDVEHEMSRRLVKAY